MVETELSLLNRESINISERYECFKEQFDYYLI